MSAHDTLEPAFNINFKRYQFKILNSFKVVVDCRQCEVRIGVCIAMTRKMLSRSKNAFAFNTADKIIAKLSNYFRHPAIRSYVDDRVVRIVVHIENGRKYLVYAKGFRFTRCNYTLLVGIVRILSGGNSHCRSKPCGTSNTHCSTEFHILCNPERN